MGWAATRTAAFAAAAALAVAGCGGNPSVPASKIIDAAKRTTAAGPMHVYERIDVEWKGRKYGSGTAEGQADGPRRRSRYDFDLSVMAKLSSTVSPDDLKGTMLGVGDESWVTSPSIERELDPPKRWIRLTEDQVTADPGPSGQMAGVGTLDPAKPIDPLLGAIEDAEKLGSKRLDGIDTRHYLAKVDYEEYLDSVPASDRPALQKGLEKVKTVTGTAKFPIDVWIGSDGLVRRMDGEVSGRGIKLSYTILLTKIGEPAPIEPPPARTVFDGRGL
jgi:hypothetical protein